MKCYAAMDKVYESIGDEPLSVLDRLNLTAHFFFCRYCARELKSLETLRNIMRTDFFPPSPDFEESLMARILNEEPSMDIFDAPSGFSFRSWVIIGIILFISLSTSFFGMNFVKIADAQGSSFLLPVGLTIAMVLTGYGAFFIASHLKELSTHFKLH